MSTEKDKKISVSIEKRIRNVHKDGNEGIPTVSYKVEFTDSVR